jgi:hypothetical protein
VASVFLKGENDIYAISAAGEIKVEPWPFAVLSFSGLIIGYERGGYPDRLEPRVIPYHCRPGLPE